MNLLPLKQRKLRRSRSRLGGPSQELGGRPAKRGLNLSLHHDNTRVASEQFIVKVEIKDS